jgi:hypothetical protein
MSSQLKKVDTSNHTRSDTNIVRVSERNINFDKIENEDKDQNAQDKKRVNINDLLKELKSEQKKSRTLNLIVCFILLSLIAIVGIIFSL